MDFYKSTSYKDTISDDDYNKIMDEIEKNMSKFIKTASDINEINLLINKRSDSYADVVNGRYHLNFFYRNDYDMNKTISYVIEVWVYRNRKLSYFGCTSKVINVSELLRKKKIEDLFLDT